MITLRSAIKFLMKRCDEAEIFFSKDTVNTIEIKNGKIDIFKQNSSTGYGIRTIKDKRMGFGFSNVLNSKILETVLKTTKISERDEFLSLPAEQKYRNLKGCYDDKIPNLNLEAVLERVEELLGPCKELGVIPTSGAISWDFSEVEIWNTNGISAKDKSTGCSSFLSTVVKDIDVAAGFYYAASRFFDLDFSEIGRNAATLAKNSIKAEEIGTLRTNVTLKPHAVSELFEAVLMPSFSADNVQRKRSFLAGKKGKKIFSELNIIDDATLSYGLATSKFDAEGVRAQKKILVEKGVLKGYLYDTYTAKKHGTESTGNADRDSFASLPHISSSNLLISGGGGLSEEGLVVHGLIGVHTSNPISGDFSVETRNAFFNGKPVKKAIIAGNIFQLLNSIEGFGRDYKQVSSIRAPSIEFSDVRVVS